MDFRDARAELVGDCLGVVAMTGEFGLEVVDAARQHAVHEAQVDRFHAGSEPGLECSHEVTPNLQRGPQPCGGPGYCCVVDHVGDIGALGQTLAEGQNDIFALLVMSTAVGF